MCRQGWFRVALAVCALGACATTQSNNGRRDAGTVKVAGTVKLASGKVVPHAPVRLVCGAVSLSARADKRGNFVIANAPKRRCTLGIEGVQRVQQVVDLGGNLLRPGADRIALVIPALRRVTYRVRWTEEGKHKEETVQLDEALPGWIPLPATAGPGTTVKLDERKFTVVKIERRHHLPVALRGAPRESDVLRLPVQRNDRIVDIGKLLGLRSIVWVGRCRRLVNAPVGGLDGLHRAYRKVGLRAMGIVVDRCGMKQNDDEGAVLAQGSREVLWALRAKPGSLLVLDRTGTVLLRREGSAVSPLEDAVAFLKKNWSVFAATERVSVERGASVSAAAAERLMAQAQQSAKSGDITAAHRLLDRVLTLTPQNAEARKQRALVKASLGDISGALAEVSWWRDAFGDEAADQLLEEVRRRVKK